MFVCQTFVCAVSTYERERERERRFFVHMLFCFCVSLSIYVHMYVCVKASFAMAFDIEICAPKNLPQDNVSMRYICCFILFLKEKRTTEIEYWHNDEPFQPNYNSILKSCFISSSFCVTICFVYALLRFDYGIEYRFRYP